MSARVTKLAEPWSILVVPQPAVLTGECVPGSRQMKRCRLWLPLAHLQSEWLCGHVQGPLSSEDRWLDFRFLGQYLGVELDDRGLWVVGNVVVQPAYILEVLSSVCG